ncbi:SDR family oxidoreductase [Pseudooceanicola sp. GBMRC 2024]|uniref:SDR family oxidoreductase n=1 Tax=Pseudooceanicola albus TaxID=2692189 RepID=A0A6L7GBR6_9RHOB|nr:SDR family oxidoreductase [Pseudooceanicola albus]
MERLFGLAGRRALVTGGSSGIGRAVAEALAGAGARVVIASDRAGDLQDCCAAASAAGLAIEGVECRLKGRAEALSLATRAAELAGGALDILVSNAGIEGPVGATGAAAEADYARVFDINLHSAYWLAAACRPGMAAAGGGSVILMASLSALRGNRGIGPYAMAKAGLAALARNLAVEWGPDNIRANAIAPGLIDTAFAAPLLADPEFVARRIQGMTPLRRAGRPEEIAAAALFLAGPGGAFVTGTTLVVDGGTLITDGS